MKRLIMSADLDSLFSIAEYEKETDYYEKGDPISIEDLKLSKETEVLLREYHSFFLKNLQDDFSFSSDLAMHNFEQLGLFLYERVIEELKDRYYVVYSPYSSLWSTNYPVIVDRNKKFTKNQVLVILGWILFLVISFWYSNSHF